MSGTRSAQEAQCFHCAVLHIKPVGFTLSGEADFSRIKSLNLVLLSINQRSTFIQQKFNTKYVQSQQKEG